MLIITTHIDPDNLVSFQETGSHYICDPPVLHTDIDYIVLVNNLDKAHVTLVEGPWVYTSLEYVEMVGTNFRCYRNGVYNLIVTQNTSWYLKFCAATEYCKAKNVRKKVDRIMYFESILSDKGSEEYLPTVETIAPGSYTWASSTAPYYTSVTTSGTVSSSETLYTISDIIGATAKESE